VRPRDHGVAHDDMKKCRACGETKSRMFDFHVDRKAKDGLMGVCKDCNKARGRAWREAKKQDRSANREAVRRYRAKNAPEIDRKNRERYRANLDENRARERERWRRRVAEGRVTPKDPRKVRARKALETAIRNGSVVRPDACPQDGCEGLSDTVEFHHTDYDRPLEGIWACTMCHRRLHHA